jgi:hypothetical protein
MGSFLNKSFVFWGYGHMFTRVTGYNFLVHIPFHLALSALLYLQVLAFAGPK